MTNEEITKFIKELREISNETTDVTNMKHAKFIGERHMLLRKAADLIEEFQTEVLELKGWIESSD